MTLEEEYGGCWDCTGKQRLVNRILRRIEKQDLPGAPDAEQYFRDLHRRNVSVHTLKTAFTAIQSFQAFLQNCVKEHDYSPPLGSCYFPTFDEEGLRGFGLNFFR